ncbi:hypothetical protein SCP_0905480 [Sparassis crispa]|uniref:Uncharacterized protein n=1 Tax=Sparassis crispa TaxID=139825 RepID=A0A401GWR4_9APHY|nr:hypothetical protein SCP_0905480 [Sparassis crispa]GBE86668.1 hypothetical protein SCP_0905480 [Sparassis crispa]
MTSSAPPPAQILLTLTVARAAVSNRSHFFSRFSMTSRTGTSSALAEQTADFIPSASPAQPNDVSFPRSAAVEGPQEVEKNVTLCDASTYSPPRTVRRMKSSSDLRDVFRNGSLPSNAPNVVA